jgi:triphosphoribosyl-dephospho-CoA synthase
MSQGERAKWSIVQEASAIKAGNVHPNASFEDMTYMHFLEAAEAIQKTIHECLDQSLGPMIWACTASMLQTVRINTSLGTVLLMVPLIQCEKSQGDSFCSRLLREDWDGLAIRDYLAGTTASDCASIYQAIAACNPGGLGTSQELDVHTTSPASILDAMRVAATWDDVALQYSNGYLEVARYARHLVGWVSETTSWSDAIRRLQLRILAERVDSHIARKWGRQMGEQVRNRAQKVLDSAEYGTPEFELAWQAFDSELRSGPPLTSRQGMNRQRMNRQGMNPGTTADMIAAALYVVSSQCNV